MLSLTSFFLLQQKSGRTSVTFFLRPIAKAGDPTPPPFQAGRRPLIGVPVLNPATGILYSLLRLLLIVVSHLVNLYLYVHNSKLFILLSFLSILSFYTSRV